MAGEREPSDDGTGSDPGDESADSTDPAAGPTGSDLPVDPDDHTVAELEDALESVEDADGLTAIREAEERGKDRKTAKAAIDRRIEAVGDEPGDADAADGGVDEDAAPPIEEDPRVDVGEPPPPPSEDDDTPADVDPAAPATPEGEGSVDAAATDEAGAADATERSGVGAAASSAAEDVVAAFGGERTGPEADREMPLADHIEEMLRRLAVVVAVAGLVTLLVFPFGEEIINFLWYSILPGVESEIARPRIYSPPELILTQLRVASLAGLILGLPVLVYEAYAFMRPGLYPHERRYYLAAIPTSLVLAVIGAAFAYVVILPAIFTYFLYYSQDVARIGFALGRTFDLILLLMGYMAVVFQIPLFVMLAMMMNLVSRRWLADRRLLFWGGFLGISFLFSPDPTGMAPIVVAATMIVLFEGTLLLAKWTGRG